MKYNYIWSLSNTKFTKDKGKVFSCFAGGGGSTMGYKLAGFDVIGCNEIDKNFIRIYRINHRPKWTFNESIDSFIDRKNLPDEIYDLDILDGSPPCSSFSIAGKRDKFWGQSKKFMEGQEEQILDQLFFSFIKLTDKIKPKIVIAENVPGLLIGLAKNYVIRILKEFEDVGYYIQYFLLDASKMGVPQKRRRVFFIGVRKDIAKPLLINKGLFGVKPKLILKFNDPVIPIKKYYGGEIGREVTELIRERWLKTKPGRTFKDVTNGKIGYTNRVLDLNKPMPTILASHKSSLFLPHVTRHVHIKTLITASSFPQDYKFLNVSPIKILGYSVPPIMMARVADEIYNQWIRRL